MGAHLPHPNSFNGRNVRFSVMLISPENLAEYAQQNAGSSLTEQVEGAINSRLDAVIEAGGRVLHIDYCMHQNALFFAAITIATGDAPVTYAPDPARS